MVLAVRVVGRLADGSPFDELIHTLDIAVGGARLGGLERMPLQQGDILEIRRKNRRACFKVMWVGEPGSSRTGHVGVQAVDAPADFWGIDVPIEGEAPIPVAARVIHSTQAR